MRVGAAPVTWRCTSYVALHPFRTGAMPTDRVHRPHQQAQPRIRTPPHGQALHHWAYAHVVEGLFMRLWPRPLIVAGIGVVSQGPEEGQAAVPVGGGGAWLRHPWAVAGPGRASRRRAQPHTATRRRRCGGRRRDRRARAGFETTRRAKLAARTARGRAGLAAAGDQAGLQATKTPEPQWVPGLTAEDGGFEPPRACTQHAFQACAIGH